MLDTNACVNYLRQGDGSSIARRLADTNSGDVVLCSIVKAELFCGAFRSRDASANAGKVNRFLAGFISIPFDDKAAPAYGEIRADLTQRGTTIGPNDLPIASIFLANGLTLVTHNAKEFGRVSGLELDDWETE